MGFHEVRFPKGISYGSRGGAGFRTLITKSRSGNEQRVGTWPTPIHRYNLRYGIKDRDDLIAAKKFMLLRHGALNGFRLWDPTDYNSTESGRNASAGGSNPANDDQSLGFGDGSEQTFQLVKLYSDGVAPNYTRTIKKPVAGTVVCAIDGVAKTEGVDYSVNTENGEVTFTPAPGNGLEVTAGFEFDVPVRASESVDAWFQLSVDDYNVTSCPDLTLVETLDDTPSVDDFFFGGANSFDMAVDTALTISSGRVKEINATAASKRGILPNTANLTEGAPYFYIIAKAGSQAFDVVDTSGAVVVSMTAGDIREVFVMRDSTNAKKWKAV